MGDMLIFKISEPLDSLDLGSSLFLRPVLRDGCYQSIFVRLSTPTRRCFLSQEMIKFSAETPEMRTISWKYIGFISLEEGWMLLPLVIGYDEYM